MPVDEDSVLRQLEGVPEYPKWRRRNEPALLAGVLEEGEALFGMTGCLYAEYTWVLFVTDRRLLFLKQGALTPRKDELRLDRVLGVTWKSGFFFGALRLDTDGGPKVVDSIVRRDCVRLGPLVRDLAAVARLGGNATSYT
jgi:hypothetical protein